MNKLFLAQQMNATLLATASKIQTNANRLSESLTTRQFMALLSISHLPDTDASYNNIAGKLGTTKQNAKQIISALNHHGYVTIEESKQDKRAVNIQMTQKGVQAEMEWGRLGNEFLLQMVKDFSTDELELFWRLLQKLYAYDETALDGFEYDLEDN